MPTIELPEAYITGSQLHARRAGSRVSDVEVREAERLSKGGFVNRDPAEFRALIGRVLEGVDVRGNTIVARLEGGLALLLAPEYGGVTTLVPPGTKLPDRFHLRVRFEDEAALTLRLTGMGGFKVFADEEDLSANYVYARDFLGAPDPREEKGLPEEEFGGLVSSRNRQLKAVLVGKDAILVGLGNEMFQDIVWRASVHPARRGTSLTAKEQVALYRALRAVIDGRIEYGGKKGYTDLDGKPGRYVAPYGERPAGKPCPRCATPLAKVAIGGGASVFCPTCQPDPR